MAIVSTVEGTGDGESIALNDATDNTTPTCDAELSKLLSMRNVASQSLRNLSELAWVTTYIWAQTRHQSPTQTHWKRLTCKIMRWSIHLRKRTNEVDSVEVIKASMLNRLAEFARRFERVKQLDWSWLTPQDSDLRRVRRKPAVIDATKSHFRRAPKFSTLKRKSLRGQVSEQGAAEWGKVDQRIILTLMNRNKKKVWGFLRKSAEK